MLAKYLWDLIKTGQQNYERDGTSFRAKPPIVANVIKIMLKIDLAFLKTMELIGSGFLK